MTGRWALQKIPNNLSTTVLVLACPHFLTIFMATNFWVTVVKPSRHHSQLKLSLEKLKNSKASWWDGEALFVLCAGV